MTKARKTVYLIMIVLFFILSVLLAVFCFRDSYLRFGEACVDFGISVKFYMQMLFEKPIDFTVPVLQYSKIFPYDTETVIPEEYTAFQEDTVSLWQLLFDKENFQLWGQKVANDIYLFSRILLVLLPACMLLIVMIVKIYKTPNTKHNKDSVPLKIYKKLSTVFFQPVKTFIVDFVLFIGGNQFAVIFSVLIWCFNFNFFSILMDFFAYYFYFAMSYNFGSIYTQFVKLFVDLKVFFSVIPWYVLLPVAYPVFCTVRRNMALARLRHMERKNRGFINDLPIVSMTCGSMGKKKTTLITDMALSQEVMFRDKAFELLQKTDMKFPYFPWMAFELELKKCIEHGTVYNIATVKEWIQKKKSRFDKHGNAHWQLYDYDIKKYSLTYDDHLKIVDIFDVLESYAKLYFLYTVESSLIVSNYSIREDNALLDNGNFPLWRSDFFPKHYPDESHHAHILDFDALRLGKKVIENNPKAGSFEFGVVVISEVGKERGNNLELQEVKKGTNETNQKNDLFNAWLKMCRHSATIDNYPFIKVFTDEQRPQSWGADARDLADIIHIISCGDTNLAIPFYTLGDMLSEWMFRKFIDIYYDFRFIRGDNTLLIYLLKKWTAWVFTKNVRMYNRYGYSVTTIEIERGTLDGKTRKKKYYLMNHKIYSKRFLTDCFSDFFNDLAKKSKVSIGDYREYLSEKATIEELQQQNSYFINSLYKSKGGEA